jgi:probable rRNA maturation factor
MERAVQETLVHQSAPDGDMTIVLTGDARIQLLNRDFLNKDAPTDVLSFPSNETDTETGRRYLGDVIISVPRARDQSIASGHALQWELELLVVHGILHLLGHDHGEADEKKRMWAAQGDILSRLGIPVTVVHE